jgi:hypothetical protein
MRAPTFSTVKDRIKSALREAEVALNEPSQQFTECTVREFYDYLTGETFSGDKTTLTDILDSPYLMVHEVVEIRELKKLGVSIDVETVMTASKENVYGSHFKAMVKEIEFALSRGDVQWVQTRIHHHFNILTDDEFLPESLRCEAKAIYEKYRDYHLETV